MLCATRERGHSRPMSRIALRNNSRSSAMSMASREARDQLDAELLEHALAHEVERAVERGLAAHRRQQRVRPLLLDDARHGAPVDRLDVGGVRHARVGHDRRRIGVHQDDPVALLPQRLAGLGARVVELAGLADHDRAGADDQDALEVGALWHGTVLSGFRRACAGAWRPCAASIRRNARTAARRSRGPGLASG